MTRREFLTATASAPIAASALSFADEQTANVPIVDSHVHCFAGPANDRFPYHADAPYEPAEAAPPEQLLRLMDDADVDFAVIVHPEPYQDDHRYLEHCLDVGRGRLKGTCLFFADQANATRRLAELVERRTDDIVALRVHAYAPERLPPLGKPELRELWKMAANLGLAIQLHFEPRYAPPLEPLIREFRDTTVLVDHLGRPFQGTPAEHAAILRWGDHSNVVMKLSSLPVRENYPHRDPASVVRQLLEAFGSDRLVYGGGFGADATAESYRAARERVAAHLPGLSQEDIAKVLGGNATWLFGFA
ncbi:MAG: amidohydrolase family protein [Planctomycetaceae bacterium]